MNNYHQAVNVHLPSIPASSYPIMIDNGLLTDPSQWLPTNTFDRMIVITDHRVEKLYVDPLITNLNKQGHRTSVLSFAAGEKYKNNKTKQWLESQLFAHACRRDTLILALGGGVVGDMAGFVAATYMRGIPYIQIPSTLLAMVDSSVGGKTAIDTTYGKNLIGAFWQPNAVVADLQLLKTLPKKHMVNGLVEALKMFLTHAGEHFYDAQKNIDNILMQNERVLKNLIYHAVSIKALVVQQDEKENQERQILNFGHTIGHAVEHLSNYKILHGVAVAFGILVEANISQLLGILDAKNNEKIHAVFSDLNINFNVFKPMDISQVIALTKLDKKVKQGLAHYVLLKEIGDIYRVQHKVAHPVTDDIVEKALMMAMGK